MTDAPGTENEIDVVFAGHRLLEDIHDNSELVVSRLLEIQPEMDVSIRAVPGLAGDLVKGKPA